jgi:xylulose-5-phosphate/fructose-6-phosphate phosphoketolase
MASKTLHETLTIEDVKHRLLGHWGASPALSFVWTHLAPGDNKPS